MSPIAYSVVMAFHAFFSVTGFGALGLTGAYARAFRLSNAPGSNEALRRYFRPGHDLAAWSIVAVPVLAAVLLISGRGRALNEAWPWVGLSLWSASFVAMVVVILPGERRLKAFFEAPDDRHGLLRRTCRRVELASAATSLMFVVALLDMVLKPR